MPLIEVPKPTAQVQTKITTLAFRGLRWDDLKRLNKDERFAKTLTKSYSGQTYRLDPSDQRYVLPIPPDEIKGSGIEQNDR